MSIRKNRFYQTLNQPPRSPNGKHRRADKKAHGRAAGESSDGAGTAADSAYGTSPAYAALDPARVPGTATYQRTGRIVNIPIPVATWRMLNSGQPVNRTYAGTYQGVPMFYTDLEEPTPAKLPYAGIRAGEIIGHRAWYVRENNSLGSLAHDFIWPAAQIEGNVDQIVDNSWHTPIYGGVYAYVDHGELYKDILFEEKLCRWPQQKAFGSMQAYWGMIVFGTAIYKTATVHGLAYGTISMWGEVIEHETGYRAQFARVKSIDGAFGEVDLDAIRRKYVG